MEYSCPQCDKVFSSRYGVNRHSNEVHSGEKRKRIPYSDLSVEQKERQRTAARKCMARRRAEHPEHIKQLKKQSYERTKVLKGHFTLGLSPEALAERKRIQRKAGDWRRQGMRIPHRDALWPWLETYWAPFDNCQLCDKPVSGAQKCADHCHRSGYFRWVVCKSCNTHLRFTDAAKEHVLDELIPTKSHAPGHKRKVAGILSRLNSKR